MPPERTCRNGRASRFNSAFDRRAIG
jgi:hypothetical protein